MKLVNWQEKIRHTPFIAATDSRSLFDNLSKSKNVAAHIEDKRAAIDLTILKNDMVATRGQIRWTPGEIMVSDSLTKKGPSVFLRKITRNSCWTLCEYGARALKAMF